MQDHEYEVSLRWSGSTGEGYGRYDRSHTCGPAGLETSLSADPTFRGDPGRLNPEQLVVMAASSCQLLSFLALAAREGVDVRDYTDDATAAMPLGDHPVRLTTITLRPRIVVAPTTDDSTDVASIERLVHRAHDECYVANSLTSQIVIEPTVIVTGSPTGGALEPPAGGDRSVG